MDNKLRVGDIAITTNWKAGHPHQGEGVLVKLTKEGSPGLNCFRTDVFPCGPTDVYIHQDWLKLYWRPPGE